MGHDSYAPGKGVFVDDVEVAPNGEAPVYFPASRWLAGDKDDGKIEREFFPGSRAPPPACEQGRPAHFISIRAAIVTWKTTVVTHRTNTYLIRGDIHGVGGDDGGDR